MFFGHATKPPPQTSGTRTDIFRIRSPPMQLNRRHPNPLVLVKKEKEPVQVVVESPSEEVVESPSEEVVDVVLLSEDVIDEVGVEFPRNVNVSIDAGKKKKKKKELKLTV